MKNQISKVAIIIPAYNESENIATLLKEIKRNINSKIIIVDDSNNDLTKNILIKEKITYIKRKKKSGRGSAVIKGIKESLRNKNIDLFIEMDADLSHNPSELNRNIKFFLKKKLDVLIASRYIKNSKIVNWPMSRKILSRISNFLVKALLRMPYSDYTNGYRIYSRNAANKVVKECGKIGDGFILLSEILMVLHNNNFKIGEIHTIFVNRIRGESSVNISLIIDSLVGLIKLFLIKNSIKKYR